MKKTILAIIIVSQTSMAMAFDGTYTTRFKDKPYSPEYRGQKDDMVYVSSENPRPKIVVLAPRAEKCECKAGQPVTITTAWEIDGKESGSERYNAKIVGE